MPLEGTDIEQLSSLAAQLGDLADTITQRMGRLNGLVRDLRWHGPDAVSFKNLWDEISDGITTHAGHLQERQTHLKVEIEAQDSASDNLDTRVRDSIRAAGGPVSVALGAGVLGSILSLNRQVEKDLGKAVQGVETEVRTLAHDIFGGKPTPTDSSTTAPTHHTAATGGTNPEKTAIATVATAAEVAAVAASAIVPGTSPNFNILEPDTIQSSTDFAASLLHALGAPTTAANVNSIVKWEAREGGNWKNYAAFNPLNTTQPEPGSGVTGSQGDIAVYTSWQEGIKGTIDTLNNGNYSGILAALKAGEGLAAGNPQVESDLSMWSGGGGAVPPPKGYDSV